MTEVPVGLMTVREAAIALDISVFAVYRRIRSKKLKAIKPGGVIRIPTEEVFKLKGANK